MAEQVILSTAYFPCIQYISKLLVYPEALIETHDTYPKQSYRNRCLIGGPNGIQNLSVPVKRPNGNRTLTRDIRVDYDTDWQRNHWRAIVSAYNQSPFFEIFAEEFSPVFEIKHRYLVDLNESILQLYFSTTGFDAPTYKYCNEFITPGSQKNDFRELIHPKKDTTADSCFRSIPYYQVFEHKHQFLPNLSFIDLLFNEGSQAIFYCKQHFKLAPNEGML